MVWTSLGGNRSPREYHRGFSYPDKNKGCTKRPQALAIVLTVHAYSPTVIADWNHRMFLVISFPRMWKGTGDWFEIYPPFVRLHKIYIFCQTSMSTACIVNKANNDLSCPKSYPFCVNCHTCPLFFCILALLSHIYTGQKWDFPETNFNILSLQENTTLCPLDCYI